MRRSFPKAIDYFNKLRGVLEARSGFKKYIEPAGGPFYGVYNIGTYTFAPFRIVWREQASSIQACVISSDEDSRHVIADHKLTLVGIDSADEAYFLCGLLNSMPVRAVVGAYSIEVQISTHVCATVNFPTFQQKNRLHKKIAKLSHQCHAAAKAGAASELDALEAKLDEAASEMWGIATAEFNALASWMRHDTEATPDTDDSGDE